MADAFDRLAAALADRYRIDRELGQGGMATVYLADDLKHDRKVALKVLRPELAAVLGAERFVQEIKTTAGLQHPHILPLYDSGSAVGRLDGLTAGSTDATGEQQAAQPSSRHAAEFLYYVMPYIQGETLRDRLNRETQLGVDEAIKITTEVADALEYAHEQGVIHRDIKPENILIQNGRAIVADFGIALAVSAAAGGRMTETGLSLGTPHYMSPEQATAEKEITARSDVYSLASVLYEMLAGQPPHLGGSAQQIIMKIIAEPVAEVTTLRRSVPPNVAAALGKALETLPADRFESARTFAEALTNQQFIGTVGTAASVGPPVRRALTTLLAATTIFFAALAAWVLTRPTSPRPVTRVGLALPPEQAPDPRGFALATSDGSRIVYVGPSQQAGVTQLWVKARDQLTATPLPGTLAPSAAVISPDDAWLAVVQGDSLRKMPITGGALISLAGGVSNAQGSVAWLDDGTLVYAARQPAQLVRIADAGGPGTVLWSSDSLTPWSLSPLPGSRGVLFAACPPPCNRSAAWVLDLRNDSAHVVMPDAQSAFYVSTRHLVYVDRDQTALAVPFDLASLATRGPPLAVLDSVAQTGAFPYFWVSTGGTVVMRSGGSPDSRELNLTWVDQSGRETVVDSSFRFRVTPTGDYGWALSPDGSRVAMSLHTASGDDLWIKPVPRGPALRITYGAGHEFRPRWRPDGTWVTFVADSGFYMRRADGTGSDSALWRGALGAPNECVLSPDGRWLVFRTGAVTSASGGRDILGLRLGVDTAPVPLVVTPYDEMAIALSPDGRWLAYQSDETGRLEVYVRPFPNTGDAKVRVSSEGGTAPLWARNGRELFYLRGDNMMMAVTVTTTPMLKFGEPRELFRVRESLMQLGALYYTPWDVAPDGRFIMVRSVNAAREASTPLIVVENWLEELQGRLAK